MSRSASKLRTGCAAVAAWSMLAAAGLAIAHTQSASDRTVRIFDFEEPGNPSPVPDRWFRLKDDPDRPRPHGAEFPAFNEASFDQTFAVSGKQSVKLPTQGGSVSMRLLPGEIGVFPDADYSVSVMVRTTELDHARAFLVARLLDQKLQPIPGSETRSTPTVSPAAWTELTVTVPGRFTDAAWLQVDVELRQPRMFEPAREGDSITRSFKVWKEDLKGAAWFDDVRIGLLPRARFEPTRPSGIISGDTPQELVVQVRDLGGRELQGLVRILDIDGQEVWRESMSIDPGNRPRRIRPAIAKRGWYRAVLDVSSNGEPVSRHEAWLVNLPAVEPVTDQQSGATARARAETAAAKAADRARLGVNADTVPESALMPLAELLEAAGTRFVIVPAIDDRVEAAGARAALSLRRPAIDRLLQSGQQVTLCVGRMPDALSSERVLDPSDTLGLIERDPDALSALLEPTLDLLGQRVLRYQLGRLRSDHAVRRKPDAGLAAFERLIARLAPGPAIGLPWRSDFEMPSIEREAGAKPAGGVAPGPLLDAVTLLYPAGFAADDLPPAIDTSLNKPGSARAEVTIVPELPELSRFSARDRATAAARRIVEAWRAMGRSSSEAGGPGAVRIGLDHPFGIISGGDSVSLRPGPELAVLRGVAARLEGRRIIGPVPAPAGVRAYLFAPVRTENGVSEPTGIGVVVAWNESAPPGEATISVMRTGPALDVYDVFGNLEGHGGAGGSGALGAGGGGPVPVSVGDSPVFIENVDPYLAMFASSLKIEPTFVPAVIGEHEHRIVITNPWPVRVTGRLQIKQTDEDDPAARPSAGGEWSITPSFTEFAVNPGETAEIPITLGFGSGQLAGRKDLYVVARALADKSYPPVRVRSTLEVGLPDLELLPEVQLGPNVDGPDVVLLAAVSNRDARPRSLRLDTTARGAASQQTHISDLPPGQTVLKRFVFRNAAKDMRGKRIMVTLTDADGASQLSRAVVVP